MNTEYYDLIINGYDWGPAVDKIIVHTASPVTKEINSADFSVSVQAEYYDWSSFPPTLKEGSGNCPVKAAVLVNENTIELELSVHPADPFCNPFIYSSDMMNHWQKIYNHTIKNEKLGLEITKEGKRISPLADQFKMGTCKTDSITLHYGAWEPANHTDKTPLIIWLHGMGEGGEDPYINLLGNKVVNLITDDVQSCFENGAYVLVPQVNGFWMQTQLDSKEMPTWVSPENPVTVSCYTKALFNLIETFVAQTPDIDKNCIYIGGCSNGGYMTMNMLLEYPDYFAAAYPVCQAYPDVHIDEDKLGVLAKQHIWFTHSNDDTTVDPKQFTLPTYDRLVKAGAKDVHLTLWEHVTDQTGNFKTPDGKPFMYMGHFSWIYTLNNECKENEVSIFKWMSQQEK